MIYIFRDTDLFYTLMMNKKIIFKTKLEYAKIYFPVYILALIINLDTFKLTDYGIADDYLRKYLKSNKSVGNETFSYK